MAKQILVIDDDTRLRELLAHYLREEGYAVVDVPNADEAREKLKNARFDLLVVDVMMPGETGLEFTEKLRKESQTPVLLLTAMGEVEDRIKGLESGADDYLVKPFEPRELCLRIDNILKRQRKIDRAKVEFGEFAFNLNTGDLAKAGDNIHLTSTELRLLTIFAEHLDEPVTREKLSHMCNGISERSVDVQVNRLRQKIEVDPKNPYYLQAHWGSGYVLRSRA